MTHSMKNGANYRSPVLTWLQLVRAQVWSIRKGLFAGSLGDRQNPSFSNGQNST
jgi:hypothetical protein